MDSSSEKLIFGAMITAKPHLISLVNNLQCIGRFIKVKFDTFVKFYF